MFENWSQGEKEEEGNEKCAINKVQQICVITGLKLKVIWIVRTNVYISRIIYWKTMLYDYFIPFRIHASIISMYKIRQLDTI